MNEGIYESAVKLWGEDMQLDMVIEECSELIHSILKYKRSSNKEIDVVHVAEEHADVLIMLSQLSYMMGKHDKPEHKSYQELKQSFKVDKITRLANRIDAAETERSKKVRLKDMSIGTAGANR